MPTKKTATAATPDVPQASAYVLRIELRDLKPAIWREVWVAPDTTLRKLHAIIQAAMGWEDCHLYGFAVPGTGRVGRYWGVEPHLRYEPPAAQDGMGFGDNANDDARVKLFDVLRVPKDKLLYIYDYGDDWEHLITLTKIVATPEPLPRLASAAFICPPEDCGGPQGFANLVDVLSSPHDPEYPEMRGWMDEMMGPDWMPGELDEAALESLVAAVARLRPRPRLRRA